MTFVTFKQVFQFFRDTGFKQLFVIECLGSSKNKIHFT